MRRPCWIRKGRCEVLEFSEIAETSGWDSKQLERGETGKETKERKEKASMLIDGWRKKRHNHIANKIQSMLMNVDVVGF